MVLTHNLGFPRIGAKRELKFALEKFWKGESSKTALTDMANSLHNQNLNQQSSCDFVPIGDFSLYDHILDTSFLLGNIPTRISNIKGDKLDSYFRLARGKSANDDYCQCVHAGEMTKWFDTNYHYIVPELNKDTTFKLNAEQFLSQIKNARKHNIKIKPVIVGPLTYLWLGKTKDQSDPLKLIDRLIPVYEQLLEVLSKENIEWVQIDEPILVTELTVPWQKAFQKTYKTLANFKVKIMLATYFDRLRENLTLFCSLPVAGIHIDAVNAKEEIPAIISSLSTDKILSLGVINGRNIWKTDLNALLDWLEPIATSLKNRLWIAPSCSLLHVPIDLNNEIQIDADIKSWLSFAVQKLDELSILKTALNKGRNQVKSALEDNQKAITNRKQSPRIHNGKVKEAVNSIKNTISNRQSAYETRALKQKKSIKLPLFPTTTIGSFPQTTDIRKTRLAFKKGELPEEEYINSMKREIEHCVREQEKLGLDVLVHGEAERNDMVEYFGEQLEGYIFSKFGWVQSYGSRCVKPPILFGDISRPAPMTVEWTRFAQSLTDKPMKAMLTGPVTILNWSFVRDDQSRQDTCFQLALAIRDEVLDLEKASVSIIQIDEAALREGLPLRKSEWQDYLDWAITSFKVCTADVKDETQIHTHMCYSEFNDIIAPIAQMDADVITIETSRSQMELLDVFDAFNYPNEIGPGVYDIHSPNTPSEEQMIDLMKKAAFRIPAERLWVNPDCGLKTRQWAEVTPALINMVEAAKTLRKIYG